MLFKQTGILYLITCHFNLIKLELKITYQLDSFTLHVALILDHVHFLLVTLSVGSVALIAILDLLSSRCCILISHI
jgi:hypothetical protein